MAIKYKNNNRVICYKKGLSRLDVISELEKRIAKRQKELDKRKWIYDEYVSLLEKQSLDRSWVLELKQWTDERWNKN